MGHKDEISKNLKFGIISISSSRNINEDKSGAWIEGAAEEKGHIVVSRDMVIDEKDAIVKKLLDILKKFKPDAVILTGGTGISEKDLTIEAVTPLFDKKLTAFSTIFALLSYKKIEASAILSRATAGIIGKTAVFCIPGSLNACKDACIGIIFPEIGHVIKHLRQKD